MGTRLKLMVFICLVSLLVMLPVLGACAPQPKPLTDLTVEIEWVEPIAVAIKPYEIPKSLAGEYAVFHVILSITNPNDRVVTIDFLEGTLWANDIRSQIQTDTPIYIPPGKEVKARIPVTMNTLLTVKQVVMGFGLGVPDAVKMVLGAWKAIQEGTAGYQFKGAVRWNDGGDMRHQTLDLRFQ